MERKISLSGKLYRVTEANLIIHHGVSLFCGVILIAWYSAVRGAGGCCCNIADYTLGICCHSIDCVVGVRNEPLYGEGFHLVNGCSGTCL